MNKNRSIMKALRFWPAITVLCFGLILSFFLYTMVLESEKTINYAGFVSQANRMANSFQRVIDRNVEIIESLAGFHTSSVQVERLEFAEFVKNILARHEDIQALEWIPMVKQNQRRLFEKTARNEGYTDFRFTELDENGQIRDASIRKEYFPVFYVEPMEGNEAALGFDLASNTARLEALEMARDTGQMITSAGITLVQEKDDQVGHLLFKPVYNWGTEQRTLEEMRRNLEGFFLGVFRVGDMVKKSLENIDMEGINFLLLDENAQPGERIQIHHETGPNESRISDPDLEYVVNPNTMNWRKSLNTPGRAWTLLFYQSPDYLGAFGVQRAWLFIAVGFPFTILVAVYIFTSLNHTARVEKLVIELQKANVGLEKEMAERRRVDEQIRKAKVELERKNEELEAFMYMAAHDLRTPIVSIHGFFGLLNRTLNKQLDEKQKWVMERISANLQHFDQLLGDLVQFSRVSDDSVERDDLDVGPVIQRVLEENSETIADLNVDIRIQEKLPQVHFNDTRLYQVFSNLISNSLKFSTEGVTPEVEIGLDDRGEDIPPGQVLFFVKDNGIGIEEDQQKSVFGLFFRLDADDDVGSGVGLAIVKRIINVNNGKIWIESVPGEGTTFFFTLPLAKSENRDQRTEDSKSLDS
jgi:signal transduction histidine kinase